MIPKFRVWDKNNKCMHEVRSIWIGDYFPLNSHVVYSLGNTVEVIFDDIELMQSTELKDKNGVEIFEGDIVKTLGADLEETLSTIKFAEGAFCVDHKNLGTEFEFLYFVDSPLEVVGNIYKNPNLLEDSR
ncbi:YopX family protein [Enterococcus mundtii]|uniref:YopX protein domain-containing protein n=1 Tax=Enterococcus mundtii TaxID=53346 RepID=A0A1V2UA83_ENTMU|nr:YopX family protein [Enterococcus mundtii]ONN40073.1 hypothetical protein BTN92_15790 [Enterococcus mundtii]